MKKILYFFRQPFPLTENRRALLLGVSLFISFFMMIYQPFGLREMLMPHKPVFLAGYGMVTFLVLVLDMFFLPFLFPGLLKESRWTVGKEILWILWIILTIGTGNYFYSCYFIRLTWVGLKGFLFFLLFTFAVSLIPVAGIVILSHYLMLKRFMGSSAEINKLLLAKRLHSEQGTEWVTLTDHKGRRVLHIVAREICCMISEGNYVNIFLDHPEKRKVLLRNTMREMERQTDDIPYLFRCHRAFIVNLQRIEKVKGNSQGYRLVVSGCEEEIPVARNLSRLFRERFEALK